MNQIYIKGVVYEKADTKKPQMEVKKSKSEKDVEKWIESLDLKFFFSKRVCKELCTPYTDVDKFDHQKGTVWESCYLAIDKEYKEVEVSTMSLFFAVVAKEGKLSKVVKRIEQLIRLNLLLGRLLLLAAVYITSNYLVRLYGAYSKKD